MGVNLVRTVVVTTPAYSHPRAYLIMMEADLNWRKEEIFCQFGSARAICAQIAILLRMAICRI